MLIGTLIPPKTLNWPENVGQTVSLSAQTDSLRYDGPAWWCAAAHEVWPEKVGQTVSLSAQTVSLRYDLRAWWCAAAHETFSVDVEL
jgi:hypothetical protein